MSEGFEPFVESPANRRSFLKKGLVAAAAFCVAGTGYPFLEAHWLRTKRYTITVPSLGEAFSGFRIAFLSDFHHGPQIGLAPIRKAVATANRAKPDVIVLGGDYVYREPDFIRPCFDALKNLRAPLGVYAVLGNHDHYEDPDLTKQCIKEAGFRELTNTGQWLTRANHRLRIAGVGDLWEDKQNLEAALGDAGNEDPCILVSHNPDYVEKIANKRVGLVLSGHTHGGQVYLPGIGAPVVPSRYGNKYRYGLVKTPSTQVLVSCGIGTISPPVRFCCRPEVVVATGEMFR